MAYREVLRLEVAEVVRRWQAGNSQRNIASGTGLSRDTVRKYLAAAKEAGVVQEGSAPTEDQLSRLAGISRSGPRQSEAPSEELLGPWADQIYRWLNVERLQLTRIQELLAARGCQVAYSSLHRFVARRNWRGRSRSTVRMVDTGPGEVAELDFGRLGLVQDPETARRRTVWALIVVLTYSRHSFVWPTFSQRLEDVIAGLEAAWAFFGVAARYLVIDNFPAAVAGADALHPRLTRGFLEYSQRRGVITDPARVRHPKDKPHVERGVQYVRERFFKGGEFRDLTHLREEAAQAVVAGRYRRTGGSTAPPGASRCRSSKMRSARSLAEWDGEPYEVTGLAHRQGPSRPPRCLPVRPLLGAVVRAVPSRTAGGDRVGQQAGAHLPPGKAAQAPSPPASRRPLHRCRRLSNRADRLHPESPRGHQAQRGRAGTGGGRIRRPSLSRSPSLGQGQAGTQAGPPGTALHAGASGRRLPQGLGRGPHRRAPGRTHPGPGPGAERGAGASPTTAGGTLRPARIRLRPC